MNEPCVTHLLASTLRALELGVATSQKDPAKIQTGSGAGSRAWSLGFGSHGNSQTQDGEIVIVCVCETA